MNDGSLLKSEDDAVEEFRFKRSEDKMIMRVKGVDFIIGKQKRSAKTLHDSAGGRCRLGLATQFPHTPQIEDDDSSGKGSKGNEEIVAASNGGSERPCERNAVNVYVFRPPEISTVVRGGRERGRCEVKHSQIDGRRLAPPPGTWSGRSG